MSGEDVCKFFQSDMRLMGKVISRLSKRLWLSPPNACVMTPMLRRSNGRKTTLLRFRYCTWLKKLTSKILLWDEMVWPTWEISSFQRFPVFFMLSKFFSMWIKKSFEWFIYELLNISHCRCCRYIPVLLAKYSTFPSKFCLPAARNWNIQDVFNIAPSI